ncbi:hypothetical protein WV31_00010 [Magnetospirillum sp. ME-1]|nr:hypothetical protein WV31_00010 [Magnetospirillum sp. ME-1]
MRDPLGYPLPVEIADRQAMFDAAPELLVNGPWVCLNIQPDVIWPVRPQSLEFAGHRAWIIPITTEDHPGVAINRPPEMTLEEAESILCRFLSVLSWRENVGITVAYRTGGNLPRMMGLNKKFGFGIRDEFDFTEVICPVEEKPQIALALMREGRSLNHHGYAFLSYWRILELAFPGADARKEWMRVALQTLTGHGVQEALQSITAQGVTDIGLHLFKSGRCAVAHATGQPIINPDNPSDGLRLYRELPLVREMAIRAIEERFGIDSPSTEYKKHLYELRGWKAVLDAPSNKAVFAGEWPQPRQTIDLPRIHVRLRGCLPYGPLESMTPKWIDKHGPELLMAYQSIDGLVEIRFQLALEEERLKFDLFNSVYGHDDGSVAAAEHRRETQRFFRDFMLNGELQMWNADTGALLSRLDAYIPQNMMIDLDACNAIIAAAQKEVEYRLAQTDRL